ncbi:MAG TPA: diaminopimelate decarboxylase [Planctomycetes bacterium]|nr:diaminopimelate decarboxylase [Planctomycetota bacterium]
MTGIRYHQGKLHSDGVPLAALGEGLGTPLYVYSADAILERYGRLEKAFARLEPGIRYAVKANSNRAILRLLRHRGAGFDLVSGGELERALQAGGDPSNFVFAGVGKQDWEIQKALHAQVGIFNIESEGEIDRIEFHAQKTGRKTQVALRLNPDVDARTHEYISTGKEENKFGIPLSQASPLVDRIHRSAQLELVSYHVHLGSLLLDPGPFLEAAGRVMAFMDADEAHRRGVRTYDTGGGFGIRGNFEEPLALDELAEGFEELLLPRGLRLLLEPGRYLVGNAGCLLTRVLERKQRKTKDFLIVDASMSELIRPALYDAVHEIVPLREGLEPLEKPVDVVGPVCESADFLGKDRKLPALERGAFLAVLTAGAYGFSMASRYNTRTLPAEVLTRGDHALLIRRRETLEHIFQNEVEEEWK